MKKIFLVQGRICFCEKNMILYLHPLTQKSSLIYFWPLGLSEINIICCVLTNVDRMKSPL